MRVTACDCSFGSFGVTRARKADVVVCDLNLGDNDALWLIQEARQHQPETPFIAVSGQDYDEYEMRLAGFTESLTKPVRHDVLVCRILSALGR